MVVLATVTVTEFLSDSGEDDSRPEQAATASVSARMAPVEGVGVGERSMQATAGPGALASPG